jgi:hypothetical protein
MNIDIRLHSAGTNKKFQKTTKGGPQIVSSTCINYKDQQKSYVSKKKHTLRHSTVRAGGTYCTLMYNILSTKLIETHFMVIVQ